MSLAAAFAPGNIPGVSPSVYSEADFRAISELIYAEPGNVLPQGKAMLVYSRIAPLVRKSGSSTFSEYIALVRSDPEQRKAAVAALTTNHTFFFREAHHFEHLAAVARPALLHKLDSGAPVRIWSAGCSSGEEVWSIVLTLLGEDRSAGLRILKRDLIVLATDLASHVLRKAEAASYPAADASALPPPLRKNWVIVQGPTAAIGPEARFAVRFRELNLLGDWPMSQPFDIIFCRNVMIYFDQPTKERLVLRFAERLRPGGFLYIGHSERVTGPAADLLEPTGPTTYRRRGK